MTKSLLTMLFIGSISTAAMAKLTGHAAHCEGVVNQKPQVTSGIETTMTFDMALKYEDNILQEIYPVGNGITFGQHQFSPQYAQSKNDRVVRFSGTSQNSSYLTIENGKLTVENREGEIEYAKVTGTIRSSISGSVGKLSGLLKCVGL